MKAINIILWVFQALIAAAMIVHGVAFLFPTADVQKMMAEHPSPYSQEFMEFIFLMEALGGIGLILPAATRILPYLTPLAALGLAIIMGGAVYTHLTGNAEMQRGFGVPLILTILSLIIAYGRWRVAPIAPRANGPQTTDH